MTLHNKQQAILPTLLIIVGPSGSGKTTLARRLAGELSFPLIEKDMIKETLADTLGYPDLAASRRLGRASMALLFRFAGVVLAAGQSCIIESTFLPELAAADLEAMRSRAPFEVVQLLCRVELTVLQERLRRRMASGERHPVHMEHLRPIDPEDPAWQCPPIPIDGRFIELDMNRPEALDYEALLAELRPLVPM
jgi:predicted kinase